MKQSRCETYYLRNILQLSMLILCKTVFVFFDKTIGTSRLRATRGVYTVSGEIYMDLLFSTKRLNASGALQPSVKSVKGAQAARVRRASRQMRDMPPLSRMRFRETYAPCRPDHPA
jgi:hypothetical protein